VQRFLAARKRADDSGCPEDAEEGNAVSMRHKAYAPVAGTRDRRKRTGDASFARSFDPCSSILTMLRRGNSRRWGDRVGITVGQTHASERNHHWGRHETDAARLAADHRFRKEEGVIRKKRKKVEAFVPARIQESPGLVARTS